MAGIHEELARYPNVLGAYLLDEIEVEIPVSMRVDNLGQVMVTVLPEGDLGMRIGRVRLRIRPILGAVQPPPVTSGQTLASLNVLSDDAIAELGKRRIFSVDDLLRVASLGAGRAALMELKLNADLDEVLERSVVLYLPVLPPAVASALLRLGVRSRADFAGRDAEELARLLTAELGAPVEVGWVLKWQEKVENLLASQWVEPEFGTRA